MNRLIKILSFFYIALLCGLWQSCKDNLVPEFPTGVSHSEELEVEFDLYLPDTDTRATIDQYGNERFSNGDVIHIVGTFNTEDLQEGGSTITNTVSRYGALRYNGTNWKAVEGSNLTWPTTAIDGQFTAYYLSESNGVLTNGATDSYPLSNLTSKTDPLTATSATGIKYGNAVKLEFTHLCAHLTLTNLNPQVADSYWMIREDDLLDQDENPVEFHNAFQLELVEGPELVFSFTQMPSEEYDGLVFISGNPYVMEPTPENPQQTVNVDYYLEPGYYDSFELVYPITDNTTFSYLKYNYSPNQSSNGESSIAPQLDANVAYTLNITKNAGTTIVKPPSEGDWDESTVGVVEVDVEAFLKAAQNGEAYSERSKDTQKDVQILEKTASGSKLLCNVDFQNFHYSGFVDQTFQPNLPENITFDGGLHYIQNLHDPLFRYNYGTICNLGIRQVNAEDIVSEENDNPSLDNSRNGALCHFNDISGTISNIRARDITLNVQVLSYIQPGLDGSETHNIGGLVGSNTGNITEINLAGNFNITVTNYNPSGNGNGVNASVLIGGIVGQNADNGTISEVSKIENENLSLLITNTCKGVLGDYAVGGFVGQSNGFLYNINLSGISINATESEGVTSYMGGMAGQLTVEEDGQAEISGCSASGSIQAGKTMPYNSISSASYSGGIAGAVYNTPVNDCVSLVSVAGPTEEMISDTTLYATGGGFGRIRNSIEYSFSDLIIWGGSLTGPANYIGTFAGIAPETDDWGNWFDKFNTYNIRVKSYGIIKTIGYLFPQN